MGMELFMSQSVDRSRHIINTLYQLGVRDFVISPGSRNAPITLSLYQAQAAGLINLHVRIDERSAAFFALGIAKASNKYVVLVCTSGTAVVNYHPALLEAFHSQVPLIALTADRPERLRHTGANQTTVQANIFPLIDSYDIESTLSDDEFSEVCSGIAEKLTGSPAHINLQLDEPLVEGIEESLWLDELRGFTPKPPIRKAFELEHLQLTARSAVVIGHDRGNFSRDEIAFFIKSITSWGVPVISEDPSIAKECINHSSLFLADEKVREFLRAEQVIVVGRTTLSRSTNAFIAMAETIVVIDKKLETVDFARKASRKLTHIPALDPLSDPEVDLYNRRWEAISRTARQYLISASDRSVEAQWQENEIVRRIYTALPSPSTLFIGSSRPIRDLEARGEFRRGVEIFANRGLAGIDGNISTTFGLSQVKKNTFAILGDVTFQHDFSSLLVHPSRPTSIFVIDNNGGGIFNTLEQNGADGFETVFGTPHNSDLEKITTPLGYETRTISNYKELTAVLNTLTEVSEKNRVIFIKVPNREVMSSHLEEEKRELNSQLRAVVESF